jgi:hypothetical protein
MAFLYANNRNLLIIAFVSPLKLNESSFSQKLELLLLLSIAFLLAAIFLFSFHKDNISRTNKQEKSLFFFI